MAARTEKNLSAARVAFLLSDKVTAADLGYHKDGGGLYLVVGSGAQRSWSYKYSFLKARREMGLGSAHKVDAKQARIDRDWCAACLPARDPKRVRSDLLAAQIAELNKAPDKSLAELAKVAVEDSRIGPTQPHLKAEWVRSLQPHLMAGVTDKAPLDLTQADVVKAIAAIRERGSPVMARKVQQRLKALFEWCAGNGHVAPDAPNPAEFTGRGKYALDACDHVSTPHPAIPWKRVGAFMTQLRAKEPRTTALCLEWIVLSAVRSTEGTGAQWSEIDRSSRTWTIPAERMKVKDNGPHVVPLSARHLEILDALAPPEGVNGGEALFPGSNDTGPAGETMRQVLRSVWSETPVTVHGFRSTFRTWAEAQTAEGGGFKYDEKLLECCLAHVVGDAVRNVYTREGNAEARRSIMDDWADFLAVEWSNVTAFPDRAAA
jgi:integrase